MKKTIKVKFVDFWNHWDIQNNFIMKILNEHYNVILSEEPDYIFFSNFNHLFDHMKYNECVKIFYTQENIVPDFNFCDYAIGYDHIDYEDRYCRFPICFINDRYGVSWRKMEQKHLNLNKIKKKGFCSFVVSNSSGDAAREKVFHFLNQYKKVDSGGRYLNNIGLTNGVHDKVNFESQYRFSLCFENSSHSGYMTEKIIEAFAAQTVPIYWGDPGISDLFDSRAFINIRTLDNLDDLLECVKRLDNNPKEYEKMLQTPALRTGKETIWKEKQDEFENFLLHIFDQSYEDAFRRNRIFWGSIYEKRYEDMKKSYLLLHENGLIKLINKVRFYLNKNK